MIGPTRSTTGIVLDDTDPQRRGRVQVQADGFLSEPFWALPVIDPGAPWAIPSVGESVLVFSEAPGVYRWSGVLPSKDVQIPDWANDEYPDRRALPAKYADTLVGLDREGLVYLGHFGATEAAVLGTLLVSKLQSALSAIEDGLTAARDAAYGSNTMDPASKALITAALSTVQTQRTALDETLSTIVKVADTAPEGS